jgi:methionine synthase I (cobalamin-dependent)
MLVHRYCLQRFGIDNVAEINAAGVRIAKEVVTPAMNPGAAVWSWRFGSGQAAAEGGKGTIVAGAVGPTGEGAGFIDDEKGAEIAAAFRTQVQALVATPRPP